MKYFLILTFVSQVLSFPIDDDRIIFPDEYKKLKDNTVEDFKMSQMRLLSDPNILIPDKMTIEFLLDQQGSDNFEDGEHFQGDMVMLEEQLNTLNESSDFSYRTGIINQAYRWPKNADGKVIVHYKISSDFGLEDKSRIILAMFSIEKYSCIEFQFHSNQSDYINIISGDGCSSYVGKIGGGQNVSLQIGGCLLQGTIIHELMHALGFHHMQNHADRDEYVDINWNNIKPANKHNFEQVNSSLFNNFGTPYDFYSVMHYGSNYFSLNNEPTIVSKFSSYNKIIGNRVGLSLGDAKRLNAMYKCNKANHDITKSLEADSDIKLKLDKTLEKKAYEQSICNGFRFLPFCTGSNTI